MINALYNDGVFSLSEKLNNSSWSITFAPENKYKLSIEKDNDVVYLKEHSDIYTALDDAKSFLS